MSGDIPTFAIVGAVNHGKSSVVATLSEDDRVQISLMPGETKECAKFWLKDLFCFWDTPGFQNAIEAYDKLKDARAARNPLDVYRAFIKQYGGKSEFDDECKLLRPIVEGAGIIYVVDGSQKLRKFNRAEMEILRMTGQPRLAIINLTGHDNFVQDWKQMLGTHFNAVREFNAHHATFDDRRELLDTLASIEQSWKPKLKRAVKVFEEEREQRIGECAEIIVELITDALQHSEQTSGDARSAKRREQIGKKLKQRFIKTLSDQETRAHQQIIELFHHRRVTAESTAEALFDSELFSEETWQLFGLNEKQIIWMSTIGGAVAGAATDLVTAGHTLLLGTVIGGAIGAVTGTVVGKTRPELQVNFPGLFGWGKIDLTGRAITVGPYAAVNFPWILLDRALGTFYYVINRAHARQDTVTINSAKMKAAMEKACVSTERWDDAKRKKCETIFTAIRKNRITSEQLEELRNLVGERLGDVSRATISKSVK